jgi:DNA polymerase elongation subunit (family B)
MNGFAHTLVGWYVTFDEGEVKKRSKEYGMGDLFETLNVLDMMQIFVRSSGMHSYEGRAALHWSARDILEYGKIQRTEDKTPRSKVISIDDLIVRDPVLLSCYNIWDSLLLIRINKFYNDVISQWQAHCDYCGLNVSDWAENSYLIEELVQIYVLPEGRILPSRGHNKYYHGIEGGYVKPPITGLHKKVFELDNTKTYPGIMISGNLSSETLVENPCNICEKFEYCESKKKVESFLKKRDESVNFIMKYAQEMSTPKKKVHMGEVYRGISEGKVHLPTDHLFIDPHTPAKCPVDGFESIVNVAIFPSGRVYRKDISSPVPKLLREIAIMRDETRKKMKDVKKEKDYLRKTGNLTKDMEDELDNKYNVLFSQQFSQKIIMNAVYGLNIYPKFRISDSRIGADVTDVARRQVWWNIDIIESYHPTVNEILHIDVDTLIFCQVIYSDTDSTKVIITNISEIEKAIGHEITEDELKSIADAYCKKINSTYNDFSQKTIGQNTDVSFEVKVESIMEALYMWGAKKNYFYRPYGGKINKVGIGRSDKMIIFHGLTDEIAKFVLKDDILGLSQYLTEFEHDVLSGKYRDKLGRPRGMRTGEENAEGETEVSASSKGFLEAMEYSNKVFGKNHKMGDKPVFFNNVVFVKGYEPPSNGMIALEYGDDPGDFGVRIDYNKTLQEDIIGSMAMTNLLAPLGGWANIKSGFLPSKENLDDLW